MTQTRFLITGATGATGGDTARQLLEKEHAVRVLAHRPDGRSEQLQKLGAEVVFGDFLDFDSVRAALNGVQRAYFCYPISPGLAQATAQFAQAAREAGVEVIVNMSQISARSDAKSAARQHWLSERVFDYRRADVHTFFAHESAFQPMIREGRMPRRQGRRARCSRGSSPDCRDTPAPTAHVERPPPLVLSTTHPDSLIITRIGKEVTYQHVPSNSSKKSSARPKGPKHRDGHVQRSATAARDDSLCSIA